MTQFYRYLIAAVVCALCVTGCGCEERTDVDDQGQLGLPEVPKTLAEEPRENKELFEKVQGVQGQERAEEPLEVRDPDSLLTEAKTLEEAEEVAKYAEQRLQAIEKKYSDPQEPLAQDIQDEIAKARAKSKSVYARIRKIPEPREEEWLERRFDINERLADLEKRIDEVEERIERGLDPKAGDAQETD